MVGEGLLLMIAPNMLFKMFEIPETIEVWPRVVGIALCVFAFYYIRAARAEIREFFEFTVQGRTLQMILFIILVLAGKGDLILLLFAGVEFASGIWTYFALKSQPK
jgi:hypothetical protein